jgi:hypothetical protein
VQRFFSARWQGQVSASRLFWYELLLVGTVVNLCTTFGSLMAAAQDASGLALLLHFSPLPWNAFLVLSLLRTPARSQIHVAASLLWFVTMTLI